MTKILRIMEIKGIPRSEVQAHMGWKTRGHTHEKLYCKRQLNRHELVKLAKFLKTAPEELLEERKDKQ